MEHRLHARRQAGHRLPDHLVAHRLVALHAGIVANVELRVPHADAVHRHELRVAADAVFHVVETHEDRQRQAVALDHGGRDHAVPPCGIAVGVLGHAHGFVEAFVVYHVDELGHLQRRLGGHARPIIGGDETGVFLLVLRVFDVEHRSRDEGLGILVVHDAQQIVSAQNALRRHLDVVVHQQHMRRRGALLERLDHAACEAAGASHILVRRHNHMLVTQGGRIERAAIVDHVHGQMLGNVVIRSQQLGLHELDVALDELLLAEGCRRNRQFHIARLTVERHLVVAVTNLGGGGRGNLESSQHGVLVHRDVQRHRMPVIVAGDSLGIVFDNLRIHRQTLGAGLRERDLAGAFHVDMQRKAGRACVLLQFEHGQRVEIRGEIDGAGAIDRPLAVLAGRGDQLISVVIHRWVAQRARLGLQQHVRKSNRWHASSLMSTTIE